MAYGDTVAKLAISTWKYLHLLKMRIWDLYKTTADLSYDQLSDYTNFILTCSSEALYKGTLLIS